MKQLFIMFAVLATIGLYSCNDQVTEDSFDKEERDLPERGESMQTDTTGIEGNDTISK